MTAYLVLQVIIEGSAPDNDLGDLAIDDIGFSSNCLVDGSELPIGTTTVPTTVSPCPTGHFHCGNGDCIDNENYCDGKNLFMFVIDCFKYQLFWAKQNMFSLLSITSFCDDTQ